MKFYVYCLAEKIAALDESVLGISGATVRLIKIEDFAFVVSVIEGEAVPVTRENALRHAAVVRSVFDQTTPLPFRFGTLAAEQQLQDYVSARKPALETKLALVRDCVEMNVKIIWNVSGEERSENNQSEVQGVGTAFLEEKRRELLGDEHRAAQAREITDWLRDCVSGLTRDEQVTLRPAERLVLAAAHLVERGKISQYREKIVDARAARPDLHFLSSGPWPPYTFANIELEFQLPFGVS